MSWKGERKETYITNASLVRFAWFLYDYTTACWEAGFSFYKRVQWVGLCSHCDRGRGRNKAQLFRPPSLIYFSKTPLSSPYHVPNTCGLRWKHREMNGEWFLLMRIFPYKGKVCQTDNCKAVCNSYICDNSGNSRNFRPSPYRSQKRYQVGSKEVFNWNIWMKMAFWIKSSDRVKTIRS